MKCKHLEEQGCSWLEHADFALSIAIHLLITSMVLFLHAFFPWFEPPKPYDLEDTFLFIQAKYAKLLEKRK